LTYTTLPHKGFHLLLDTLPPEHLAYSLICRQDA
jgi:hypothetical protein